MSGNWEFSGCEDGQVLTEVYAPGTHLEDWAEPIADNAYGVRIGDPADQGAVMVEGYGYQLWHMVGELIEQLNEMGVPKTSWEARPQEARWYGEVICGRPGETESFDGYSIEDDPDVKQLIPPEGGWELLDSKVEEIKR